MTIVKVQVFRMMVRNVWNEGECMHIESAGEDLCRCCKCWIGLVQVLQVLLRTRADVACAA